MPKKYDKKIKEEEDAIDSLKNNLEGIKKRKMPPDLEETVSKLSEDLENIVRSHEALKKSYLTQLKKVYLNPFYYQVTKKSKEHDTDGIFIYNREAIAPYTDSLFV